MVTHAKLPPVELLTDFSACQEPVKRIFTADDIPAWLQSEAYARIMTVLVRCNMAVRGRGRRDSSYPENEVGKADLLAHYIHLKSQCLASFVSRRPVWQSPLCSISLMLG